MAPSRRCLGRRAGHVCRRNTLSRRVVRTRPRRAFSPRRLGCPGRRNSLGHHVHPVPQSLPDRHESSFLRDFLFLRRIGYDGTPLRQLPRPRSAVARIAELPHRHFLADARRFRLGHRRRLPAVRRQIHRHQPRHPAFQLQSTLGLVVGDSCFRGVARPEYFHLPGSHRGIPPHDARSWRHCVFFGNRPGADPLERGGYPGKPPLRGCRRLRRSPHGRAPGPR